MNVHRHTLTLTQFLKETIISFSTTRLIFVWCRASWRSPEASLAPKDAQRWCVALVNKIFDGNQRSGFTMTDWSRPSEDIHAIIDWTVVELRVVAAWIVPIDHYRCKWWPTVTRSHAAGWRSPTNQCQSSPSSYCCAACNHQASSYVISISTLCYVCVFVCLFVCIRLIDLFHK